MNENYVIRVPPIGPPLPGIPQLVTANFTECSPFENTFTLSSIK
jgi:hypothetical protein